MDHKSSMSLKISVIAYISAVSIILVMVLFLKVANTAAKDRLYVTRDFCSGSNGFMPVSEFSVDSDIPAFFNGHLIYSNGIYSDYEMYKMFNDLLIYESGSKKFGITNIVQKHADINKEHTILSFFGNTFTFFIMQNEGFVNPIPFVNPRFATTPFLNNVYYLNENDIVIRFRTKYKNSFIPVIINGYSRFYSGNASFSSIPYQIMLSVDGKLVYQFKLDFVNKKTFIELKTLYFRDNMLKYIIADLSDGNHDIEFKIIDINNNMKSLKKTIEIATEQKKE